MSSVNNAQATARTGTGGFVTADGTIVTMTPESLVALCGMNLRKFDETMLDRMNEQKSNLKLQEELGSLTQLLGADAIGGADWGKLEAIRSKIDSIQAQIKGNPKYEAINNQLEQMKKDLRGGLSDADYKAKTDAFGNAFHATDAALAKAGLTPALRREDFDANGKCIRSGLENCEFPEIKMALAEEHRTYNDLPHLSADSVKTMGEGIGTSSNSLNSRNDEILMELQSIVSQRSTSIQMTSNLTNALLEASKTIASNIGK